MGCKWIYKIKYNYDGFIDKSIKRLHSIKWCWVYWCSFRDKRL